MDWEAIKTVVGGIMTVVGFGGFVYCFRIGWKEFHDTVPNRSVPVKSERGKAPSTDLREVYWIADPIDSRVVREGPMPGTTGDIEPEEAWVEVVGVDQVLIRFSDGVPRNLYRGEMIMTSALDAGELRQLACYFEPRAWRGSALISPPEQSNIKWSPRLYNVKLGWSTEGRHAGFRSTDYVDDLATGVCAICGNLVYGAERVCPQCFQERRGA